MHSNAATRALFILFLFVFLSAGTLHAQSSATGGPLEVSLTSSVVSGDNLFAGSPDGGGVFRSDGPHWTPVNRGLTDRNVRDLAVNGSYLFAATAGGVFRSVDDGESWTEVSSGLMNTDVIALAQHGTSLVAVTGDGAFFSVNNGKQWWSAAIGLPGAGSLEDTLDEGTSLEANIDEIDGAQSPSPELPVEFSLRQNYPNPFNPVTTIHFDVPVEGLVSLIVFDLLGREVASLLGEMIAAGTYHVTFDGSSLPSGTYLYRLKADGFVQTKQLILLK